VVIFCVAGAAVATKLTTPQYQTSAQLIINGSSTVSAEDQITGRQLADELAMAFAQIIPTAPAVQAAVKEADASAGPFAKAGYPSVTANASGTDPFIQINVSDTDPSRAQAVANAYVKVLPKVLKDLDQPTTEPNEIKLLDPAPYPSSPYSPKTLQNLLIGLALGLVLGAGAALVLESLDSRLKDSRDVEDATGLTVLGVVPYDMPGEPLPAENFPMSARAEAYRTVRTNLAFVTEAGPPRSIIITSASSSEGKTSLAVNLAVAAARAGQRVILMDADLRRPMVQSIMQTPEHPGLVNVLAGITTLEDAIQFSEIGKFDVLTSGPVPSNPNELIGSNTMLETIRQLERDYDMVIIDTPPILPVADSLNLSVHVDGVVLVTRLGETTRDRLRRTKEALENVHATIIGAVPNGAAQREDSAYSYTYTYTDKALRKPKKTQGSPRDAEIDAHPDNLRPATRDDQTEQTAVVASTVASSTEGLSRRERRARHAAEGRRRSSAGTVPIGDTTGTSTADPLDAIDFSSKSSRNAPEKDASTDPPR